MGDLPAEKGPKQTEKKVGALRWRGTRLVRPCSQLGAHAFKVADVNAKLGQNYAIGG